MLKLVKYEFMKARTLFLSLVGVALALEVYFLIALNARDEQHVLISILLLSLCSSVLTIFALVRGVTTYSSELNRRSGWLLFMTPNSTLKIMGSKFLYTFLNGFFFATLISVLAVVDFRMMMQAYGNWEAVLELLNTFMTTQGVPVNDILVSMAFMIFYAFLRILAEIALAYLAITISCTMFRDRRARWLPALLLFFGLSWLVGWVCGKFPSPTDELVLLDRTIMYSGDNARYAATFADGFRHRILPMLMPTVGVSVAVILASLFGCSAMLKKWVSL